MRKYAKHTALALATVLTVTSAAPAAEAATVKNLTKASVTKSLTVGVGKKKKIDVKKVPTKTKITYVSKNKKIATVNSKGTVKGKKVGKTTITVKLTYKKKSVTKKCKVTVKKAVTKLKLNKSKVTLTVGKTHQIKTTVTPSKASKELSYTSSKKTVATVSAKGLVKAKKAGKSTITVKALDGSGKKAKLTVTVKAKSTTATATPTAPTPTAPTQNPAATATTVPTSGPAATPVTPATPVPSAGPVTPAETVKTITASDLDANKAYTVTGAYDKVVVEASVGNDAKITIADGVKINTLTLKSGVAYTVEAKQAVIANVEVVETAAVTTQVAKPANTPELMLGTSTEIKTITIQANIVIKGNPKKAIEGITISKKAVVIISAPANVVALLKEAAGVTLTIDGNVTTLTISAEKATVDGSGNVTTTEIKANDANIASSVKTTVKVDQNVTGTVVADKNVAGGATVSTTTPGGSSSGGSSSGGSSSGGSSSGGSTGGNTTPTATPTATPITTNKEFKYGDAAPKFKATYTSGDVAVYTVDLNSIKKYYKGETDQITYTVEKMNEAKKEVAKEKLPALVTGAGVTGASIIVDKFTCKAEVSSNKTCKVTVSTTDTSVSAIEFVNSYVMKSYKAADFATATGTAIKLTANDTTYGITYAELAKLYDVADGKKGTVTYTVGEQEKTAEVTKESKEKGSFEITNGNVKIKCEVLVDTDARTAYVVVSSEKAFDKFELD